MGKLQIVGTMAERETETWDRQARRTANDAGNRIKCIPAKTGNPKEELRAGPESGQPRADKHGNKLSVGSEYGDFKIRVKQIPAGTRGIHQTLIDTEDRVLSSSTATIDPTIRL